MQSAFEGLTRTYIVNIKQQFSQRETELKPIPKKRSDAHIRKS